MKRKRRKHKESFSILLVSNTGGRSRQYHFSIIAFRLIIIFLLLLCAVAGGLSFWASRVIGGQENLRKQLASQEQVIAQLEKENELLASEVTKLTEEADMQQVTEEEEVAETEVIQEPEQETDSTNPNRFPSSGTAMLISSYSQEQPYMSFGMKVEDSIIATGDGTVVAISDDDAYSYIIDMEHESGYRTRYMCSQEADLNVQEGDQVESGAVLLTITMENTQLDYQVFLGDEPINPIDVIDAKG